VTRFSGGMRRRLEIARALLHSPAVLVLDEPTVGLDPESRRDFWSLLRRVNQRDRVTIFLTTHYMDEAERVADTIVVIGAGTIVAAGSAASIKSSTAATSLEDAYLTLVGVGRADRASIG
jgi:ABC-2 type transport system ATP-binding protein